MNGLYDYKLVAMALVVASLASYTALNLAGRVSAARGRNAWWWLLGGALSMGTGVWAMHFIGMLSFTLPIAMAYDFQINLLSWVLAVIPSGVALYVVSRPRLTPKNITAGASVMGAGIAAMHYTGMLSMQMSPSIEYDPVLFVASVIIAIAAALAALWISFRLRHRDPGTAILAKLGSALVMGIAITGMHYTGMAAAQFSPDSVCLAADSAGGLGNGTLAVLIGVATFFVLVITLVISAFDASLAAQAAKEAKALQSANEQLRNIALYDNLTGLPNRVLLDDRMEQAIVRAGRSGHRCAIMFIDLDKFKAVNDTLGHRAGDELLKAAALRLLACIRKEDTVARVGGDEFIMVLSEMKQSDGAAIVGSKVLAELSRPFYVEGHDLNISCSIGISVYPDNGTTLTELAANADMAMYQAKKEGRNGYRFFAPEMAAGAAC